MNATPAARLAPPLAFAGVCLVAAALAGCGGSANKAHVTGKVVYNGAPVTGGTILLYPSSGDPFSIYIKADGTFDVEDAPVGDMKAAIETDSVPVMTPAPAGSSAAQASTANMPKKVAIPAKFNKPDTSGLTWDTAKEKTKTFDLSK